MSVEASRLRSTLCTISLGLTGLGLGVEVAATQWRLPHIDALVPFLSLSYEHNVPTWFSSVLLFCCALALGTIARSPGPGRRAHWAVLGFIFLFMSLDETAQLHEHLGLLLEGRGVLYFSWVIPAALAVAVGGLAFLPFLRALPSRRRNQFMAAGVTYVAGALLMELPLGWWTERAGNDNLTYAAIDHLEELLEMLGASLFLAALVEQLQPEPAAGVTV